MKNLQEKKLHGQPDFPFAVYPGRLPEFGTGYPLHWHEELELICVHSGTGIITVQGERYLVQQGDLLLIPPHRVHSIQQRDREEMHYHNILFRLSLLETHPRVEAYTAVLWDKSKEKPCFLPRGTALNEALTPPVMELLQYRTQRDTAFDLMVYSHLYRILYHIVAQCGDAGAQRVRKNASYEKMQEILEYLKENHARPITVPEAAGLCGFSESHFMRLFRELTGTSFTQYVKLQRLNTAAELLRTTGKRVGEIAEEVGIHNLSYFTRSFEEKYHMTPSGYRSAWQEGTLG